MFISQLFYQLIFTLLGFLFTQNYTSSPRMFLGCELLENIPKINTSNVMDMSGMFGTCRSLTTVSGLNTANVRDMSSMFLGCGELTVVSGLNTVNVRDMRNMFFECIDLVTVDKLNLDSIAYDAMPHFLASIKLKNITFEPNTIHYSIGFDYSKGLTKESLLSILNGLGTPKDSQNKTLTLHSASKALLSADELKIATDKGWVVA